MQLALGSALITAVLAAEVTARWRARRRPHLLLWALSLWLGALAPLAYALSLALASPGWFRLYYVTGALLVAPVLGAGSVYLGFGRRAGRACAVAVAALGLLGAVGIATAPLDRAALAGGAVGSGRGVLDLPGWTLAILIALNGFGTVAVAGVAVRSAVELVRRRAPAPYFVGNLLIAAGIALLAVAGSAARFGEAERLFWPLMTAGWIVVYAGFRMAAGGRGATARQGGDPS